MTLTEHARGPGPVRRPDLDGIPTYSTARPGPVPVRVRASSNEAPGETPGEMVEAIAAAGRRGGRYPVIAGLDLAAALAARHSLAEEQVAVGDGALSLLDRTLLAFVTPGAKVVMAWRSYEAYPISAMLSRSTPVLVPLTSDGTHDLGRMAAAVDETTAAVIVCNPNNPTGTRVPWPDLVAFLDALPTTVLAVVDEAYVEYADPTDRPSLAELASRPNAVVLRTFSKAHAMAGLRVGWAASTPEIISAVRSVSPPFPVSAPGVAAALCSLEHPEWLERRVRETRAQRDRITALVRSHGLPVLDSQSNFVWLPIGAETARFAQVATAHGVLVRPFPDEGVRITVGDPALPPLLESVLAEVDHP